MSSKLSRLKLCDLEMNSKALMWTGFTFFSVPRFFYKPKWMNKQQNFHMDERSWLQYKRCLKMSTLDSLKATATSSKLRSSSSLKHVGLYPFLNHSSFKSSGIFILCKKANKRTWRVHYRKQLATNRIIKIQ